MRFHLPALLAILVLANSATAQTQKESVIRTKDANGIVTQNLDLRGTFAINGVVQSGTANEDIIDGQAFTGAISWTGLDHYGLQLHALSPYYQTVVTPAQGDMLVITDTIPLVQYHDGTEWNKLLATPEDETWAQGDLLYFDGADWIPLVPGAAGQYLETKGAGTAPQWSSPAGSGDMLAAVFDGNADSAIDVGAGGTGGTTQATGRAGLGLIIGTDIQAYHGTLAAVAAGTYTGTSTITTLGTITTGTWNGIPVAAAYLGAHASTHIDGGSDPIDGDKIEITYSDNGNYTANTSPAEADTADDLTAHLEGIDIALGNLDTTKASTTHAATHIDGGSDPIDGDKLELSYTANDNYTPSTSPVEADSSDDLTAHLEGIDAALGLRLETVTEPDKNEYTITIPIVAPTADTSVGDGQVGLAWPAHFSGTWELTAISATLTTEGTTGTTDFQLRRGRGNTGRTYVDMLTTVLTVDSGETDSATALAAAVIDTTYDDITDHDVVLIDIDAISTGTAAKGAFIHLTFERQ